MELVGIYLKSRIKVIVVCILIAGLFSTVYLLFGMPGIVVVYPLILSLLICIAAAVFDFIGYRERHKMLTCEELPDPSD